MNENNFMRVEDVAKELGISISHSYKVMQQLNKELKAKGYMTIAGRVNRKYFIQEDQDMANSLFIKADEVAELLGVSRAEAYRIIKRLNDQLSSRGFIVVNGRVNRKYLEEQIYGFCNDHQQGGK